jgi:hypothetical protein
VNTPTDAVGSLQIEQAMADAVWAWAGAQHADVALIFRLILALMAQAAHRASAHEPLVDAVNLTVADIVERSPMTSAMRLESAMQVLGGALITPHEVGRHRVRLREGPLLDIVRISDGAQQQQRWLVRGGQWTMVHLRPRMRAWLCRTAWATFEAEGVAPGLTIRVARTLMPTCAEPRDIYLEPARFSIDPATLRRVVAALQACGLVAHVTLREDAFVVTPWTTANPIVLRDATPSPGVRPDG